MTASVFRLLGFWELGKRAEGLPVRQRPALRSDYADALSAGWVPPPPVIPLESPSARCATGGEADAEAFLARVYLHQQC